MYFSLQDSIDRVILDYCYKVMPDEPWDFGDAYLMALQIHMEFYELGIYESDN